jgi:hypothetical protein
MRAAASSFAEDLVRTGSKSGARVQGHYYLNDRHHDADHRKANTDPL